jgi:aarF domain-containing kinase
MRISLKISFKVFKVHNSACRDNDGLYVKMGQSMATMDHLLPPPFYKWFSKLQDKALASPVDKIKKLFKE